ncbi:Fe-S cluster assembly sulfur transfer protein SufU [Metabacillus idriensis]|uniref:Fe-S cluster assembly sulfur transfer protein SufU n=1 Tax=Metabacillus idriensis TaxID=324768 RepID=UPI003D2BC6A9
MLDHLYRRVIMDHYKNKRNFHELEGKQIIKTHYKNPTCGDVMTLFLEMKGSSVERASFLGEGCSISMASASMMTELITNRPLTEILVQRTAIEELIRTGDTKNETILGDSLSLQGVSALRARHNCALMAWQALDKALKNEEGYLKMEKGENR